MTANPEQAKKMRTWIKDLRRSGYIVEEDRLMYKIRDPKTKGLIMTAKIRPHSHSAFRQTLTKAEALGVTPNAPDENNGKGESPPPVWGDVIQQDEPPVKQEATAVVTPYVPKGRGSNSPERIANCNRVRERMKSVLESLGGDNPTNRWSLYQHGCELAEREGRRVPGDTAGDSKAAVKTHMTKLLNGDTTSLWDWVDEFWTKTFNDIEGAAKPVKEGRGIEDVVPMDEVTVEVIQALRSQLSIREDAINLMREKDTGQREQIERLRTIGEELANDKSRLESLNTRQATEIENNQTRIDALQTKVEELQSHVSTGSPIGNELSVEVLTRMLTLTFPDPDDQAKITEAMNLAAEIARRTT